MDINRYRAEPKNYRDTPYGYPLKFDDGRIAKKAAAPAKRQRAWGDGDDDDPGLNEGTADPFDRWNRKEKDGGERREARCAAMTSMRGASVPSAGPSDRASSSGQPHRPGSRPTPQRRCRGHRIASPARGERSTVRSARSRLRSSLPMRTDEQRPLERTT